MCFAIQLYNDDCMSTNYNPWILHIMMIDAYMMNDVKSYRTSNIRKSDISWLHSAEIHPNTPPWSFLLFRCFHTALNQPVFVCFLQQATFGKDQDTESSVPIVTTSTFKPGRNCHCYSSQTIGPIQKASQSILSAKKYPEKNILYTLESTYTSHY